MLYSEQHGNPEGKPLVLIHGWGMHSGIWQTLMPELEADYRITLIDLPGLGQSANCLPQPYGLEAVIRLLSDVAPESAFWLGWSLGGIVSMAFAQQHPERVSGLITLGSSPCFVERSDWSFGMDEMIYRQFENDLAGFPAKTLQRFNMLQVKGSAVARSELKFLKKIVSEVDPATQGLVDSLSLLRGDYRELYRNSQTTSLHLLCELDTLAPAAMAAAMNQLQPAAQIQLLAGLSHVGFLSEPRVLADKIRMQYS